MTPETLERAQVLFEEISWLKHAITQFDSLHPPLPDQYRKPNGVKLYFDLASWASYVNNTRMAWQAMLDEREQELEKL